MLSIDKYLKESIIMGLFGPSKGTPEPAIKYVEEIVVTHCIPFVDVLATRLRRFLKNLVAK
jgi:hypothetical protein